MRPVWALCALAIITLSGCAATYPGEIDSISGNDSINQLSADSAPQQSVVNGWTARDYLELAARQNTEVSVLLYVAVAVLVIIALTLLTQSRRLLRLERALTESATATPSGAPHSPGGEGSTPNG